MRTPRIALPMLMMILLSLSPRLMAQTSPEPPKTFDLAAIDAYAAGVVRDKGIPGLALTIVRDGKIVLSKGYGQRSIEDRLPVEADTPFSIGSVTKQFACACIFLLAEDGKLSVDDKVSKYFPDLTRAGEITLYQLMTHTSGYTDYYPLDFVDRRMARATPLDTLIQEYAGTKLDFEPGSRWSYSNTGYIILGRVVEKVSGQPFGEFLRKRILNPLGMKDSVLDPTSPDRSRAHGYLSFALGPLEPAKPEAEGWLYAAGGLWTSAPDLARWDIALMAGKVLKPESIRLMTTPVPLTDGRTRNYGCGVTVARIPGNTVISHGGAVSGFRASNTMLREAKSAVIVLINGEGSAVEIATTIQGLLAQSATRPIDVPKVAGPGPKDAALDFFHQMQAGKLDRDKLGEEFTLYLNPERIEGAAARLKELGEPSSVTVGGVAERGGLEVASIRMTFKTAVLTGSLYRSTDGKIQQLLFEKE